MTTDSPITWRVQPSDWWSVYVRRPIVWLGFVFIGYLAVQGVVDLFSGFALIGLFLLVIGPIPLAIVIAYRSRQFARFASDIVVSPEPEGLRVDAGSTRATHDWAALTARDDRLGVLVANSRGPILLIPWRAFGARSNASDFVDLVRSRAQPPPASPNVRER